jgi:dihydroorotate dehydrogenase
MYRFIRWFLFLFNPERAHYLAIRLLRVSLLLPGFRYVYNRLFNVEHPSLRRTVFGIDFPNPVGLAAGFDKNATMLHQLNCCGFGFIEIGTVTPLAQSGNDQPRLFRLKEDQGLINRMGFNNDGVDAAIKQLKNRPKNLIVGGNIGKNKRTPNEEAENDYLKSFEAMYPYVDYFVVNVSSPNTPNLRELQDKEPLTRLLVLLVNRRGELTEKKPILLKIAPDLTNEQLDDIIDIVKETSIDGVIATNTTIDRVGLSTSESTLAEIGAGGLSGKPLEKRSTEVIRYLHQNSTGSFPIIGVGGIHSAEDAMDKLKAGASLIQLYTGFIYEGPGLIKRINKAIINQEVVNGKR